MANSIEPAEPLISFSASPSTEGPARMRAQAKQLIDNGKKALRKADVGAALDFAAQGLSMLENALSAMELMEQMKTARKAQ